MFRVRPVIAGVVGWIAGAATSVVVGLLALSLIGDDLTDGASQPWTADALAQADAVSRPSAQPSPTAGRPSPTGSPSAAAEKGVQRRLSSAGGDVVARCQPSGVYLLYWTPAQGFRAHDVVRGPAERAKITFEGSGREVKIEVTCADGVPEATVTDEHEDDH
ncbi:MAG TPA: hypothetical protein VF163_17995 [Micromonosporaceae bacterium]